ncbi:SCP2 sterol-binding domain-containing protein [Nocardia aurea]|uniref:SCP2 sterol-binding domain-containing protein n=1 Tax=Nocardia aurea TaxID=2144174 RepID=UPI0033BDE3E7
MSRTVVLHAVFDEMPRRLIGDRVDGVDSVVCWRIGEPVDMWTVVVANSRCTVHQGNPGLEPTVTLELGMVPFLRMIAGQMGGMALLVTGNLRIKGNMMTARKMEKWFVRD